MFYHIQSTGASNTTDQSAEPKAVKKKKEYVLRNWTVRPLKNGCICVEGEKQ